MRQPRWRAARRQAIRDAIGFAPMQCEVWAVYPTALKNIPDNVTRRQIKGLPPSVGYYWLKPSAAKLLITLDRAAGGHPRFQRTPFRRCLICARPLIDEQAIAYRMQLECAEGKCCGANCAKDFISKLWIQDLKYFPSVAA